MLREKGYEVEIDASLGKGRQLDVLVRKNGQSGAIEIETGKSNHLQKLQSLIGSDLDKIVSVVLSEPEADRLMKALASSDVASDRRVVVVTLTQLLQYLQEGHCL